MIYEIKPVRMNFVPVKYRPLNMNENKAEIILNEYDQLLCDLMCLAINEDKELPLKRLIQVARRTPFYKHHKSMAVADVVETFIIGLARPLEKGQVVKLPCYEQVRIARIFSAISQALAAAAQQIREGITISASETVLEAALEDLMALENYYIDLVLLSDDFDANNGDCSYVDERRTYHDQLDSVIRYVKDKLGKL